MSSHSPTKKSNADLVSDKIKASNLGKSRNNSGRSKGAKGGSIPVKTKDQNSFLRASGRRICSIRHVKIVAAKPTLILYHTLIWSFVKNFSNRWRRESAGNTRLKGIQVARGSHSMNDRENFKPIYKEWEMKIELDEQDKKRALEKEERDASKLLEAQHDSSKKSEKKKKKTSSKDEDKEMTE